MPLDVTLSRGAYRALLAEIQRASELCGDAANLRFALQGVPEGSVHAGALDKALEACKELSRLRVELSAIERRVRELDQELTPIRPPSRTDIKAAFDASVEFASGKKKPEKKDE